MNMVDVNTYWILDGPIWKFLSITEMLKIIYITEQFVFELWVIDHWNGTVLVQSPRVALEAWREIGNV